VESIPRSPAVVNRFLGGIGIAETLKAVRVLKGSGAAVERYQRIRARPSSNILNDELEITPHYLVHCERLRCGLIGLQRDIHGRLRSTKPPFAHFAHFIHQVALGVGKADIPGRSPDLLPGVGVREDFQCPHNIVIGKITMLPIRKHYCILDVL
jgi:hypothetical protein